MQLFLFDSVTTSVVVETIIGLSKETFEDARDAEDAMCKLDRVRFYGRELEVEFARGDRKTPNQMRTKDRPYNNRHDDYDRRHRNRSGSRSPRRRRSRSRSPNGQERLSRSRSMSRSQSYDRRRRGSRRESKSGSRSFSKERRH